MSALDEILAGKSAIVRRAAGKEELARLRAIEKAAIAWRNSWNVDQGDEREALGDEPCDCPKCDLIRAVDGV